jgi:uncharacterized protein YeeX (DUF496 family)
MFKLVEGKPKKIVEQNLYMAAFARFYIGKMYAIQFSISDKEDYGRVEAYERFEEGESRAFRLDIDVLSRLNSGRIISLVNHKFYITVQLDEEKIKVKNRLKETLDMFDEYTFNDLEMGLFKAARKRARKKLKTLKEQQCISKLSKHKETRCLN